MRVRHLNCATLCPRVPRSLLGARPGKPAALVCHVLVLEGTSGLVLVDTGFGVEDCKARSTRLGHGTLLIGPRFDERETALHQVLGLGHAARDVRHVVVTHLDLDHAGGIPDFPEADVHVMAAEHEAAMARRTMLERSRYRPVHWHHGPRWRLHEIQGERWNGFEAVQALEGGDLLLVPLEGHTRGHAGVAVRTGEGWLLHAGDAYFHERELAGEKAPLGLELFQRTVATDDVVRRKNRDRLRELARTRADVRVFCAHSPEELESLRGGT